ncbi:MAG: cellulose synthase/poly-beta-1,6-N-acetylglucosamine synthase-like glycosyltransferase [Paraglaciecola sp.]|jgi:cellulose synthase/poly-beta-1,6-N-acetylglucosamine synthase-like glycosyltransferase
MQFLNDWLVVYVVFSSVLMVAYVALIWRYLAIWKTIPVWQIPNAFIPKTVISILIPARNEAENIEKCLSAIFKQNYPRALLEVIVIDDFSEDETPFLVESFSKKNGFDCLKLIKLSEEIEEHETQSFKKKSLEIAILKAKGNLIITTDADCVAAPNWLNLLVSFYEKNDLEFIAAPVNFYEEQNVLEKFQSLDFMGMMCVTAAGIHSNLQKMCNGANLAYSKKAYLEVDGFKGIDHLASGDDMLLMHKIVERFPSKIGFLKNTDATIFTTAKPDLKSFFSQRLRWATKNASYADWKVTVVLVMVFFFCCNIVFSALLIPFSGMTGFAIFLVQLLGKTLADFIFLGSMAHFFKRKELMSAFLSSQLLHILYIVIVGFLANIKKKYVWKGRTVK